jgi:16S rRNA (adenine1518-N6/adenine1519-N6)-dimethyltransferase
MTSGALGPRAALAARGLHPKHSFGQNFLADANVARKIAELATTPEGGTVVEIGAGTGALTEHLAARAARVVTIERDRDLVPVLRDAFAERPEGTFEVLEADAKGVDYAPLLASGPPPHVLAGNLPYQITGPLLTLTVELAEHLDRAVYMLQLEVGERLVARPGTSSYGGLTVFVQAAFSVEKAFVVRRGAFFPQPNVDSVVVVLTPLRPRVSAETPAFRALVKGAFAQRRKTLRNAWKGVLSLSPEGLARAATEAGIDLERRGETLGVEDYARMAQIVERLAAEPR